VPLTFVQMLQERCASNAKIFPPSSKGQEGIDKMIELASLLCGSSGNETSEWAHRDLDAAQTRTQEREQQVEQEREKQREVEQETTRWKATQRDLAEPLLWSVGALLRRAGETGYPSAFSPLARFQLKHSCHTASGTGAEGESLVSVPESASPGALMKVLLPTGKHVYLRVPFGCRPGELIPVCSNNDAVGALEGSETVQDDRLLANLEPRAPLLLLSENFAARAFSSPRERRLRSLHVVLQHIGAGGGAARKPMHVALSLLEAATVRRLMAEGESILQESRSMRLLCFPSGAAMSSYGAPPALSVSNTPELQMLRYFDCQTDFCEEQGNALLSLLSAVAPAHRQMFFTACAMCRRRDRSGWSGSTLAPLLLLQSYGDLVGVAQLRSRIKAVMRERGLSPLELARIIDTNHNQTLSIEEIMVFLSGADIQGAGMPSSRELAKLRNPLLLVADKRLDGHVSFQEFEEFLK
jgi:hypothetical protein